MNGNLPTPKMERGNRPEKKIKRLYGKATSVDELLDQLVHQFRRQNRRFMRYSKLEYWELG